MGTTSIVNPTMNPLSIILLAVASLASADVTCDECVTSMGALVARLTSEESIAEQVAILTGTICPGSADPDACNEGLPLAWPGIAAAMYPEFLEGNAVCGDIMGCVRDWTCEECQGGIAAIADMINDNVAAVVEFLSGDAFCGQHIDEHPDCPENIANLMPQALAVPGPSCPGTGSGRDFSRYLL